MQLITKSTLLLEPAFSHVAGEQSKIEELAEKQVVCVVQGWRGIWHRVEECRLSR